MGGHCRIVLFVFASLFPSPIAAAQDVVPFDQTVVDGIAAMQEASRMGDSNTAAAALSDLTARDTEAVYCHFSVGHGFEGYLIRLLDRELYPEVYDAAAGLRDFDALNSTPSRENDLDTLRERGVLFAEAESFYEASDDLDVAIGLAPERVDLRLLRARIRLELFRSHSLFTAEMDRLRSYCDEELLAEDLRVIVDSNPHGPLASLTLARLAGLLAVDDERESEMLPIALDALDDAVVLLPS